MLSWLWPTSAGEFESTERQLLEQYVKTPFELRHVDLADGQCINTLILNKPTSSSSTSSNVESNSTKGSALVVTHGFGAGLGIWYRNLDDLVSVSPCNVVYAIDWLGCGRSTRAKFPLNGSVDECEAFFLDSLKEWLDIMGHENVILCGHSLGGYLAGAFALKYPEYIDRIVLVSPVGIPVSSEDSFENLPLPQPYPFFCKVLKRLWDSNITPQSIVRGLGHVGPSIVHKFVTRRFNIDDDGERDLLASYLYHVSAANASGEFAMNSLLKFGAYARSPLLPRFNELSPMVQVRFIYGSRDWTDMNAGRMVLEGLTDHKIDDLYISSGGHNMYHDNPTLFKQALYKSLRD